VTDIAEIGLPTFKSFGPPTILLSLSLQSYRARRRDAYRVDQPLFKHLDAHRLVRAEA
jgi:hypothetical protein